MVHTYRNANRNRIVIGSVSFIVAVIGYIQYLKLGNLALVNVIVGGLIAIFEFIDVLILHSKRFKNLIKKIPIIRYVKVYEIEVAEDYLLCEKGRIQIIETKSFPVEPNLFLVPDGNGGMIYGKYLVQETGTKTFVLTNCNINNRDKERALLKII